MPPNSYQSEPTGYKLLCAWHHIDYQHTINYERPDTVLQRIDAGKRNNVWRRIQASQKHS